MPQTQTTDDHMAPRGKDKVHRQTYVNKQKILVKQSAYFQTKNYTTKGGSNKSP